MRYFIACESYKYSLEILYFCTIKQNVPYGNYSFSPGGDTLLRFMEEWIEKFIPMITKNIFSLTKGTQVSKFMRIFFLDLYRGVSDVCGADI